RQHLQLALSAAERLGDLNLFACAFETFWSLAAAVGQHARAVCLAAAAATLREARGSRVPPAWQRLYGPRLKISRGALDEAEVAAIQKIGRAMSLEEVVAYARDPLAALPRSGTDKPAAVHIPENELLSPREREVARLVARGLSNAQIAEQLIIS